MVAFSFLPVCFVCCIRRFSRIFVCAHLSKAVAGDKSETGQYLIFRIFIFTFQEKAFNVWSGVCEFEKPHTRLLFLVYKFDIFSFLGAIQSEKGKKALNMNMFVPILKGFCEFDQKRGLKCLYKALIRT